MHAMHARLPKHFVLEERLERYADAIETCPQDYAGLWAEACHPLDPARPHARYREVRLDLGCGKGTFSVESARREPDVLFVGMDYEPICIAYAAQRGCESGLANVLFVPGDGSKVTSMFAPGELSRIYLNYSTPFPRKKKASERLTYLDKLMDYRKVLAPGGTLCLRTDSYPFHRFSLGQLELAGYELLWTSDDAGTEHPAAVESEYERRLTAKGAPVYALEAKPGPAPARVEQTAPLSLMDYLPEDLSSMDYIPHGMERTVVNLRNFQVKEHIGTTSEAVRETEDRTEAGRRHPEA